MAFYLFIHLIAQAQTVVEHRQEEAFYLQCRIQFRFDNLDRVEQLGNPFQCEELALYRNDDAVACCQRVHRNQTQRRTAINQDIVIFIAYLTDDIFEQLLASLHIQHLDLCSYQVDMAWYEMQILGVGGYNRRMRVNAVDKAFVNRVVQLANLHAQTR